MQRANSSIGRMRRPAPLAVACASLGALLAMASYLTCPLIAILVTLGPGESITLPGTWSGLGRAGALDDPTPLPPGEYDLRGRIGVSSYGFAHSVPLRVRITP